jgi:hypothetical protein
MYISSTVIRLPFPESLKNKFGGVWESEDYLSEKFGELWDKTPQGFELGVTSNRYYIDYVESTRRDEVGEYGYVEKLNDEAKEKYKALFDKGEFEYNVDDLKRVRYCYYNSCEAPDYYDITEDEFYKEII